MKSITTSPSSLFIALSKVFYLFLAFQLLPGCASIVSHSTWNVPISSNPPGASVSVVNLRTDKEVFSGTTPATANLKSGGGFFAKGKYRVDFNLPGHKPFSANLEAKINGWYFGNIVFGGIVGLLIIDPATGAMFSLDKMSVHAELTPGLAGGDELRLRVYNIDDIPEGWKGYLVRVK